MGFKVNIFHYNLIVDNLEEIKKLMNITPSVVTMFCLFREKRKKLGNQEDIKKLTNVFGDVLDINNDNSIRKAMWAVPEKDGNMVLEVQNYLKTLGMGEKSVWKYLLSLNPLWIRTLFGVLRYNYVQVSSFKNTILTLVKIKDKPRFTFLTKSLGSLVLGQDVGIERGLGMTAENPWFLRKSFRQSLKENSKFYNGDFILVRDYVLSLQNNPLDRNQQNAPWSYFMRQQKIWHEQERQRRDKEWQEKQEQLKIEREKIKWTSLIGECSIKVDKEYYLIVPLTNWYELSVEGQEMHHCVASYSQNCIKDKSRIFSIRLKDKKMATTEITGSREKDGEWHLNQVRGPCNAVVSEDVTKVSEALCVEYNRMELFARNVSKNNNLEQFSSCEKNGNEMAMGL